MASFYLLRAVLGLISAGLEYRLVQYALPLMPGMLTAASLCSSRPDHCPTTRPALKVPQPVSAADACRAAKPYLRNHVPFLLLLAFSSGTFLAPTTLLPSTFMMYCMISATTGVLTANCTVRIPGYLSEIESHTVSAAV